MLTLKVAVSLIAGFAVFAAVLAALLPSQFRVTRRARIARPRAEVARIVADMSQRTAWIPWVEQEPDAVYTTGGAPLAIGSSLRFEGKQIGAATVRLLAYDDAQVKTEIAFVRPMTMTATDTFTLSAVDGGTEVEWTNEGTLAYGPARFFGLFADRVIGGDYARGLELLRDYAETGRRVGAPSATGALTAVTP